MGISVILTDPKSASEWVRNLGLAPIMACISYERLDFFTLDKQYQIIEKRKRNTKTDAKYITIRHGIKEFVQMYKETYKN